MAKTPAKADAHQAQAAKITADEFGINQSTRDKRVELLGAFVVEEKRAGRHHDLESAYLERLAAFAKRPV